MGPMHRLRVLTIVALVAAPLPALAAPELAVSTNALAFGDVKTSGTTATRTFDVMNIGDGSLDVSPIAITGGEAGDYSVNPAGSFTVNGGQARTVTVTFNPSANGARASTLTVTTTGPADSEDVSLTGAGVDPLATANPTSLAFGNVDVGVMSTPQQLVVTNTGNQTLAISSANFVTNTQFVIMTGMTGAQNVMPGQTATWMLRCYPTTEGVHNDLFRVSSNAANDPQLNVAVSCTGGRLNSNQTTFDFGLVRAGDVALRPFTLTNTGPDNLTNFAAVFSAQAGVKGYSLDPTTPLPGSLAPGDSVTIRARFLPLDTTSGTQLGETHTLRITATSAGGVATGTRVMTLFGDGLSAGYVFDPTPALAIGAVRWDTTRDLTFQIRNPYESTVRITGVNVEGTGGTATGEIQRIGNFTAQNLLPNGAITITVRADPNNRIGAMTGLVTVTSDLGAAVMPTRTLAVTATSTTAMITADPPTMTFDFGPRDVDLLAPTTQIFKLRNTGDATLNINSVAITNGPRFTVTGVSPMDVPPNTDYSVTVSYDPSAVSSDTATLDIGVAGIIDRPMPASFAITGRGIDRQFAVDPVGMFPETYRNPGSKAPVQDVVVRNLGDATLHITAVMVTGEPVWALVDAAPIDIPGKGSGVFKVRFAPTTGGKAPQGKLILLHDDDITNKRAEILLEGDGKNPSLSVAPAAVISLGTTALGFPVKLSDLFPNKLTVLNSDTVSFKVRALRLSAGAEETPFELTSDLEGDTLAPGESRQFDVVFTASKVGAFTAQLEIYLDEDTVPATMVQLTGTAVGVDVKGGGGCQAADGGTGGLLALGLGALLLGRRRSRRRRDAATARSLSTSASMSLAVSALALALTASTTLAQSTSRNLDLSSFRPAPSTTGTLLQVESPLVGARGAWELGLAISYSTNPLQVATSMGDTYNLVSKRTVFDLGLAFAIAGRLELGARMATMSQDGDSRRMGDDAVQGLEPGVGTALGDALLHAKLALVRGVALAASVTLPTATEDAFAGPGKLGASGLLLLGTSGKRLSVTANLGFGYQDKIVLGNITQGNRALFGAGASFRAADSLWLSAEAFGSVAIGQREREAASPVLGLVGLRYRAARVVDISVGAGTGIMRGIGAPKLQGVIAFELSPNAGALEPIRPPRVYVPPPDRDRDGVPDADDGCPGEAEDLDGFGDSDGCPDPDNDFDGIPDALDKCPLVREDKDGIADDDGCPDTDDDGDNIPVPQDKCPGDGEDFDGFQDDDGCPDLDNDRDGILDAVDKCPLQPETINDKDDNDGCPDAGESLVLLGADRIDLVQPVTFAGQTDKLTPVTISILAQVAATLRANPEIGRLRIGVHVNRRGKNDLPLTQKRATAIREWLVLWGVEPHRLDVRGFGSARLIVKAKRKDAAAVNDRVEFTIMEHTKQ